MALARSLVGLGLGGLLTFMAACTTFGGDAPFEPPIDGSSDAGAPRDSATPTDASAADAELCPAASIYRAPILLAEADTVLSSGANCPGANNVGAETFASVGDDRSALVRFNIPPETQEAWRTGRVLEATLTLPDDRTCGQSGCGVDARQLPPLKGRLNIHPARSDWDEGSAVSYSGADHCRRKGSTTPPLNTGALGWGPGDRAATSSTAIASGADYDAPSAGVVDIPGESLTAGVASLDVARVAPRVGSKLSFYVIPDTTARLVIATKEGVKGSALLSVTYCTASR